MYTEELPAERYVPVPSEDAAFQYAAGNDAAAHVLPPDMIGIIVIMLISTRVNRVDK